MSRLSGDMRIALIGQAAFGESVLDALVGNGENVVAVFCPPDRQGLPADPMKAAAERHGTPVHQFKRMRDREAIDAFTSLEADIGLMAYVTDIVPDQILEAPSKGTIQYHPSLLPRHRGPSSINWPIIRGETSTGLTIFWPDKGLDTGPILLQREVTIGPDDTVASLYFDKLFPMGVEAMVEATRMVSDGTAPRIPQDESLATYEGWCRSADVAIDWDRPVDAIYNLVRGSDPSPGAWSTLDGRTVRFYRAAKLTVDRGRRPGEVAEVAGDGFEIAAGDGGLRVHRVQPEGSGKMSASEWAESVGLRAGVRFESA